MSSLAKGLLVLKWLNGVSPLKCKPAPAGGGGWHIFQTVVYYFLPKEYVTM